MPYGFSRSRNEGVRAEFRERFQHESSLRHARMGNFQVGGTDPALSEEEQVEVDRARTPGDRTNPTQFVFNLKEMAQEIPRGKFTFQFRRPVEVARLVGAPFRFRPLEGGRSKEPGAGHFPKMLNRPFQVGPRVSQVRSKSDVSECHS